MLKQTAIVISILFAAGCSAAAGNAAEKEKPKNAAGKETVLEAKNVSRKIELVDGRTKEAVYTFDTSTGEINAAAVADELAQGIDQPMIPARLVDGSVFEGQKRVILDEKATAEMISNLNAFDRQLILPIEESVPNVKPEDAAGITNHILGEYKTTFNPKVEGRVQNIKLSSNSINNVILGPGDKFYYNLIVGERTEARGYQKALEIVNKEFVEGIGGGICQTSSTLYNAVDQAGLGIIELHHHSKTVGYVPKDRDATVSWGGPDFKFQNNREYPVLIRSTVDEEKGSITIQVLAASASSEDEQNGKKQTQTL
ncbi:vancomycin resistance protein [Bacillus mangrovi]|uniref:Vancomycin resistance protein n=1 Tax=Metabacillus mangrovi TaxID=1491830 RepID=A0A7X2V305_9BACI|nr:VanW family protein [Metabacillus mangrovi]MTH51960.1 vancomycin resistance protein [Metabacillus mangrovi]